MKSSSSAASPAVTQAQDDIQALNLQYNGLCDECDALDITKGNLEAEVRALSEQHADLLRLRDTIPTDVLGAATTELKTVRDAIDLETHNLQQTQDRHQKLAQACAQLADEHTGLVQQLPEVRADLAEARTTLAQLQQDKSNHEEQCCALQAANVQRKAVFATETQASIIRQDNLQENVASLEDSMKNMQDRKDAIEQELLNSLKLPHKGQQAMRMRGRKHKSNCKYTRPKSSRVKTSTLRLNSVEQRRAFTHAKMLVMNTSLRVHGSPPCCRSVYVQVYMYVYVYMYVCVYVCIYIYIRARVGVHMHSCRRILFIFAK